MNWNMAKLSFAAACAMALAATPAMAYGPSGYRSGDYGYQNNNSGYNSGEPGNDHYSRGELNRPNEYRQGYNNRSEGNGNQYGYNGYRRDPYNRAPAGSQSADGRVHYGYRLPGNPTERSWERGHACYTVSCMRP